MPAIAGIPGTKKSYLVSNIWCPEMTANHCKQQEREREDDEDDDDEDDDDDGDCVCMHSTT